ncbi:MAG TPA: hypothetical protein VFA39_19405 [Steroidobacteraceae bacterium]|nr:hypothetical protein [Steroidobacteraceae bacterium]
MSVSLQDQARTPKTRPVFIAVIAAVFVAIGQGDVWRGAGPLASRHLHPTVEDLTILGIGTAALLGGIFVFKGHNWARWLLAVWMALHVAFFIRQPYVLLVHLAIFTLILAGLFHPAASRYFRQSDG